ncbi:hypothetical protein AB4254_08110 [Vibrio breoganii]
MSGLLISPSLTEAEQALFERMGGSERNNTFLITDCCSRFVFFSKVAEGAYFEFTMNPENYPSVEMGLVGITDEALVAHIYEHCDGWVLRKSPLDIKCSGNYVDAPEELECANE